MSGTVLTTSTRSVLLAVAIIAAGALLMGADFFTGSKNRAFEVFRTVSGGEIVTKVEVINLKNFDSQVALFNRTTGEIRRFHGSLDDPNVRNQWLELVDGVDSKTSGLLDIQFAGNQMFLVDAVTGKTWILRERASVFEWDPVRHLDK